MLGFKGFLSVFGTLANKVAKTCNVLHETWYTTLFGIYYYVEMVIIENNILMLDITC